MSNNKDSSTNSHNTSENKSCILSNINKSDLIITENKITNIKSKDESNVNQFSFNYKLDEFLIKNNGQNIPSKSDDMKNN